MKQFVDTLIKNGSVKPNTPDYMDYGYQVGWLEDMDITYCNEPLQRKNAARILHEFMRIELKEADVEDISPAKKLRDLYDCRVCAKHVMQVYTKGIMEGNYLTDTLYLFEMNRGITVQEAETYIARVFQSKLRITVI